MKLKDALEKATPGPWVVHPAIPFGWTIFNKTASLHIAEIEEDDNSAQIDAALIAHARNHIGPLVEVLEGVLRRCYCEESSCPACSPVKKALTAANEVNVS